MHGIKISCAVLSNSFRLPQTCQLRDSLRSHFVPAKSQNRQPDVPSSEIIFPLYPDGFTSYLSLRHFHIDDNIRLPVFKVVSLRALLSTAKWIGINKRT